MAPTDNAIRQRNAIRVFHDQNCRKTPFVPVVKLQVPESTPADALETTTEFVRSGIIIPGGISKRMFAADELVMKATPLQSYPDGGS